MRSTLSSTFVFGAATFLALQPVAAQTRATAKPSPTDGAQTNIVQLCKFKEAQIVQLNTLIGTVLGQMNATKEAAKQTEYSNQYQALRGVMVDMESSWQRLGCINLQINAPRDLVGR